VCNEGLNRAGIAFGATLMNPAIRQSPTGPFHRPMVRPVAASSRSTGESLRLVAARIHYQGMADPSIFQALFQQAGARPWSGRFRQSIHEFGRD